MDAPSATRATVRLSAGSIAAQLALLAADALLVLVALLACFIWVRRAAGALVEPLPAAALIGLGAALGLTAVLFRRCHGVASSPHRLRQYPAWSAPTAALLLAAGALSLPESSSLGLIGLWGLVALEEGWYWERLLRGAGRRSVPGVERGSRVAGELDESSAATRGVANELSEEGIWQYLARRRDDATGETLEGWVRADFAAAQRHATVHVAICPPFERTPRCFAEISDGPDGDVRIAQVLPYGVRFEVKLDKPAAQATSATIEFSIQQGGAVDAGQGDSDQA